MDGGIGKADRHSDEVGSACRVVDTGPWIFGKEVLLPAGAVSRIDVDEEEAHVDRTGEQVENAPEFHREKHLGDAGCHDEPADCYRSGGAFGGRPF
ncbi:PRC-barrel domain containing protein [Streptomyces sp. NPDC004126]|uniref:PRC-barrel domain containing protein n=1 Tax=Streptomyces sp. NPDC004126 TaxID=3390695 RepID=UPI003D089824